MQKDSKHCKQSGTKGQVSKPMTKSFDANFQMTVINAAESATAKQQHHMMLHNIIHSKSKKSAYNATYVAASMSLSRGRSSRRLKKEMKDCASLEPLLI